MADAQLKKGWYVLRAISGKEAKVKEVLDAAIKNTDLGRYMTQVLIPTQKVYTTRNGKKVLKERNLYPGYVFIEAILTGEVQYELRNTTNVIDFLRGRLVLCKKLLHRPAAVVHIRYRAGDYHLFAADISLGGERLALLFFELYAELVRNVADGNIAHIVKGL